jgi:hypothetical protein
MKGKRVVVFALPGAFTPTCSSTHLPGYEKHYEAIKACGVDEIYCLSVNDAFVMRQWGLKQGCPEEMKDASNPLNPGNFQKTKLLPDGAVWVALLSRKLRLGPLQTHAKHAALLPQCPAHMPVLSPAHFFPAPRPPVPIHARHGHELHVGFGAGLWRALLALQRGLQRHEDREAFHRGRRCHAELWSRPLRGV